MPTYPQLPTESGYGLVEAFVSGGNADDDFGIFRSDHSYRSDQGGHSHRLNQTVQGVFIEFSNKPDGFNYDFVPDDIWGTECYGNNTKVKVGGFTPGASYLFQHYVAETWQTSNNDNRRYYVKVNGTYVGPNKDNGDGPLIPSQNVRTPYVTEGLVTADASGFLEMTFEGVNDNATYGGFSVWGTSAPTWTNPSIAPAGSDVSFTWSDAHDVLRYYVCSADSAEGPWTDVATLKPGATGYLVSGAYNPNVEKYWRVVASNGVGTVSVQAKLGDASAVEYTDIATLGETIASDSSKNYRVAAAGTGAMNALGSATTEAAMYMNGYADAHTLAIASGETLKAGTVGVLSGAGDMTLGDVAGQGAVSPLSGVLTLDVKDAASTLTVNAVAAKTSDSDSIVKFGSGAAKLAGGTDIGNVSIGAGSVELANETDATLGPVLSGSGTFVKSGAGKLTVSRESPNFTGTFEVKEGTLGIDDNSVAARFGGGAATIKVDSGATLDVNNPNATGDNAVRFGTTRIVFEGTGADGAGGALVNSGGRSQYNALSRGELSGDATVNAVSRFDFRSTDAGAYLNLNGHTLTKKGGNDFTLTSVPVNAGADGAKIRVEEGRLGAESGTTFNGNGSFEFAGGTFDMYNLGAAVTWPFYITSAGGRIHARSGNDTQNFVASTVTLAEGSTLAVSADNNIYSHITGKITGSGKLLRNEGGDTGVVKIDNAGNDWTGGTEVNKGILYVPYAAALPDYSVPGKITVSGTGKLSVKMGSGGTDGWSVGQLDALIANATAPADGRGSIAIDTNGADMESGAGEVTKPIGIGKTGEGTYKTAVAYTAGGGIYVDQGTLVISNNAENTFSSLQVVKSGRMEVYDSDLDFGANHLNIGNARDDGNIPRLVLGSGAYLHTYLAPAQTQGVALWLGSADVGGGILEVQDGAVVSNRLFMGNNQYSQNAILQSGGEIVNWGGHSSDTVFANSQYTWGYWEVAGTGSTAFMGYSQIAKHPIGYGTLAIRDEGSVLVTNVLQGTLTMSRGGHAAIDQSGGTFETAFEFTMGDANDYNGANGTAVYEMRGGNANIGGVNGASVKMADRTSFTAQINFNGGVLAAKDLYKADKESAKAYATFNGGTFKAKQDGATLFASAQPNKLDAAYVYEKGAVFDTDGHSVTLGQPLRAPTGLGVKSIYWKHADAQKLKWKGDELMGPPTVVIEGDGYGATAVVDFDRATCTVKGIVVTCPGWGYTEKPTVRLFGGGLYVDNNTQYYTIDPGAITMGTSSAGPVVKEGAGTLTLEGVNGVVGAVVRGGTLVVPEGASIQQGPLTLAGGMFSAPSFTATELVVNGDAEDVSTLSTVLTIGGEHQSARKPGLYTTFHEGDYDNTLTATEDNAVAVVFDLEYADSALGEGVTVFPGFVNRNIGCAYDGYIWNRTGETATWTFAEFFDDNVYLEIDGVAVLNNTQWDVATIGSIEVSPGAHRFHLVVYQGTGGSGPANSGNGGWITQADEMGVCVDFQGHGEGNIEYFQNLVDPGDGSLFTLTPDDIVEQDFAPEAFVHVNGGTLKIAAPEAGLYGGFVANGTYRGAASPRTGVYPDLDYANVVHQDQDVIDGNQNSNIDYVFEGYIWNHGEQDATWTFAENFDDNVFLTIDGVTVLDNGSWDTPSKGNFTLTPGAHAIRIGLHQGTGGSGPSNKGWLNVNTIGIGIDFQGHDAELAENYVPLTATAAGGELPLLTTTPYMPGAQVIPSDASFAVSSGATVDLGGSTLTLTNGFFSAQGEILNGTLAVSGDWTIDAADIVAGNALAVDNVNLSEVRIVVTGDADLLDKNSVYTLLTATGAIVGEPSSIEGLPRGWAAKVRGNRLVLSASNGFSVMIQ